VNYSGGSYSPNAMASWHRHVWGAGRNHLQSLDRSRECLMSVAKKCHLFFLWAAPSHGEEIILRVLAQPVMTRKEQ
jgi:hypothetical protein